MTVTVNPNDDSIVTSQLQSPAGQPLQLIGSSGGVQFSPATAIQEVDVLVASKPTPPASTSVFAMQGLAGAITPQHTGSVVVLISGVLTSATVTAGDGLTFQISYGSGAAPANAGTLAGTQVGPIYIYRNPATVTAADVNVPFTAVAVITGLTLGTAYWLDLAAKSVTTASSGGVGAVSVVAFEVH